MNEESKAFQKDIEILENKINDKIICKKLYNAVRTPLPTNTDFRDYESGVLELLSLFGNDEIEPLLSAEQINMAISSSKKANRLLKRSLKLWELYARLYEQELMMNLVFQGVTGELLKEFIAVFYQPLAEVYKAADIGTTIRHVSAFLDDLIQVIDQLKQVEQNDVSDTIQLFIDLVARHEQHFYDFIHNVHSQEASKVFDELIQYVDKLFTFVAHGIPGKMDINHCIERAGFKSRKELELLEQEIDSICDYRYKQKMYHFERTRRKLMLQQKNNATQNGLLSINQQEENDLNEQVFQYIPKSSEMMGALQDFQEFDYEDESIAKDDHSSNGSSSDSDSDNDNSSADSSIPSRRSSKSSGSHVSHTGLDKPELIIIPKIVPFFVDDVLDMMK